MHAKKAFGQHFLHDRGVLAAIVRALDAQPGESVVEIGPGTGRLTAALVTAVGPERLVAIEQDRDMIAHLAETMPELRVLQGDAARFDLDALLPAAVVGNLPYNASTAIFFHLLDSRLRIRRMVLMFQREVAERLVAVHGCKAYGPPSVLTKVLTDARLVLRVGPHAFHPPPKVWSAVLRVDPLPAPRFGLGEEDVAPFNEFVHGLFRQRRKTVSNNLRVLVGNTDATAALAAARLDPSLRAEAIAPETLVDLWRHVVGRPR